MYWFVQGNQLFCRGEFRMLLNTARRLVINYSRDFAAMPMSSTICANWSALITGSNYSCIEVENSHRDLLRLCSSLRCANVLLAKINASTSTDRGSAICNVIRLGTIEFQRKISLPCVVQHLSVHWWHGCSLCSRAKSGCWFFVNLLGKVIYRLVFVGRKWDLRIYWMAKL